MRHIVIIALIINLNVTLIQATCIKTLKLPESDEYFEKHSTSGNQQRIKRSNSINNQNQNYALNSSSSNNNSNQDSESGYSSEFANNQQNQNPSSVDQQQEQFTFNSYNNLRLEYYKYKILSHLSMTAEPTEINSNLDLTLRNELISDLNKKLMINHNHRDNNINNKQFDNERKENGVANLRQKRSLGCNQVKSNKDACCLETFYVNFTEIGWDKWIIYPAGYNANYCRGQCDLSHSRYYHSTLLSKFSDVIGLCCSPKQMAPLRLLYIDEQNKVHQKTMPDMVVESCDCA